MFFEKRSAMIRGSGSGVTLVNGSLAFMDSYVNAEKAIRNSDIWTAVNIISSDIARVELHSDNETVEELLHNPSQLTNRYNFFQSMVAQMLLAGNAYALRRIPNGGGPEFWEFITPQNVTVWLSDDGQSLTYDFNFDSSRERDEKGVASEDVIHFRLLSTDGGMMGRSPLASLSSELALQDQARKLSLATLRKAIMPSSTLKSQKPLNKDARDAVRTEFEKANSGDNAGRVLVLDPLFDFTQSSVSADVAKLITATDWTRDQISKVFMIPSDTLGGESEHSNADQIKAMYNNTLGRYLAPVIEELSLKTRSNVHGDVRTAIDLDGSDVEKRTSELLKSGVIDSDIAFHILAKSQSDLVDDEIVKLHQQNELKGANNGERDA